MKQTIYKTETITTSILIMKKLLVAILGIAILLTSCQADDLMMESRTADITGFYQFEKTSMYPTIGQGLKIRNKLSLTVIEDTENASQVLIEELGIYAKVTGNKLDIPFQTDNAGQFSYTGYGEKIGARLQLFLNIQNHTFNTIQTCEMQGTRIEALN